MARSDGLSEPIVLAGAWSPLGLLIPLGLVALLVGLTVFSLANGLWLLAAVSAIPAPWALITSGLDAEARAATRLALARWLAGNLGGDERWEPGEGPALWLSVGWGQRRLLRRAFPWEVLSDVERCEGQHGRPWVWVVPARGEPVLISGYDLDPARADALAARLSAWRVEHARALAPGEPRCALCHGALAPSERQTRCGACGASAHEECARELGGRCPTLGCAPPPAAAVGPRLELGSGALVARVRVDRTPGAWLTAALLSAVYALGLGLVTLGLLRRRPWELVAGALLLAVIGHPVVSAVCAARSLVELLTSTLAWALEELVGGVHRLEVTGAGAARTLRVVFERGPVRLTRERLAAADLLELELDEGGLQADGWRVYAWCRSGEPQLLCRLAEGLSLTDARALAAALERALGLEASATRAASKRAPLEGVKQDEEVAAD